MNLHTLDLDETIKNILCGITVRTLINNYALENIVIGAIKPNQKINFDKYVRDLKLDCFNPYKYRDMISGTAVDGSETIINKNISDFLMEFFSYQLELIFVKETKSPKKFDFLPFNNFLREYFFDLFSIFKEISYTSVNYDFYDSVPKFCDKETENEYLIKLSKFLAAIKINHLRPGSCVDRYVKSLPFLPISVQRLVKFKHGRYLLSNLNADSIDYKIAIFSAFRFMNKENYAIFELKAEQWRKRKLNVYENKKSPL